MLDSPTFRATVVYSNSQTGEIRVRIPTLGGLEDTVPISTIGRKAYNGVWAVPEIGSQIVVTTSDDYLYNVYWVQVEPSAASYDEDITALETDVAALQSGVSTLETTIIDINNKLDALYLGIFS